MIRRVLAATVIAYAIVAVVVYAVVRMPLAKPIGGTAATSVLAYARATLQGAAPPTIVAAETPQAEPVILTLYDRGLVAARGVGRGATLGDAVKDATSRMRVAPDVLARGRLKLDRILGRGFLSRSIIPLFALGAVPARDGVGASLGTSEAFLTVDDLLRENLWAGYLPAPAMEFSIGLHATRTLHALADQLGASSRRLPDRIFRFRAEEYLEEAGASAIPIVGGAPPGPSVSKQAFSDAARAGGRYLRAHLGEDGRFDYEYFPGTDLRSHEDYSWPRHAGATSFLAQLYALDHDRDVKDTAQRALAALEQAAPPGCDGARRCVGALTDTTVDLGSSALALVAESEYERTTGSTQFRALALGLAQFILDMQKTSGDFCHLFDPETQLRDERTQLLYYSGEASYGLARMLSNPPIPGVELSPPFVARATEALDRGLEYLTTTSYAHFAGQFYVGEDHWTCMAVDAGWDLLPPDHRERYARFCDAFSDFMRRTQFLPGDGFVEQQPEIAGAYGLSPAVAPHATPVGSRSESLISVWNIARRRGLRTDDPRVTRPREQVLAGMRFLLDAQIGPDATYLMPVPEAALGGLLMSRVERHVRIDFLQHSCSALLRALPML